MDSNNEKVDGERVLPVSTLEGKNKEYFVVIPIAFYQNLKNTLIEYEYTINDYYYFCDCIFSKTEDYFEDSHGNKIVGNIRTLR